MQKWNNNLFHADRITIRKQLRLLIFTLHSLTDTNTLITTDLRQLHTRWFTGQISEWCPHLMAAIYLSEQFSCVWCQDKHLMAPDQVGASGAEIGLPPTEYPQQWIGVSRPGRKQNVQEKWGRVQWGTKVEGKRVGDRELRRVAQIKKNNNQVVIRNILKAKHN